MRNLAYAVCAWAALSISGSALAAQPLVFGVFPRFSATETVKKFTPIAHYLSEQLRREVVLTTAKDFETFEQGVAQKQYDIVLYNQLSYVRSHKLYGYQLVAKNEEFGRATLAPAIVVRKDGAIRSLSDLRGRKIVFGGDESSMIAYVANIALLQNAGLKRGDYAVEFAKTPMNAALAVLYKQADAAGAGDSVLKILESAGKDVSSLTFVAVGETLPHIAWATSPAVDATTRVAIARLLLALNESPAHKALLAQAGMTGIVAASDDEYDVHRRIIKAVLGESY